MKHLEDELKYGVLDFKKIKIEHGRILVHRTKKNNKWNIVFAFENNTLLHELHYEAKFKLKEKNVVKNTKNRYRMKTIQVAKDDCLLTVRMGPYPKL